jgi:hypothetical protein
MVSAATSELGDEQDRYKDHDGFANLFVVARHVLEIHHISNKRQDQHAEQTVECGVATAVGMALVRATRQLASCVTRRRRACFSSV